MHTDPHTNCGYTCDPPHQNACCYRNALPDTDRCAWHADPEDTDQKTVRALQESRVDPETREQTRPYDELLDGAVLQDFQLEDRISLNNVALRDADLSGASFRHADLRDANLTDADLRDVDLRHADLRHADLTDATLFQADLTGANLSQADQFGRYILDREDRSGADLPDAYLGYADLSDANLYRADLTGANLAHADLSGANLYKTDLTGAKLGSADLSDADLKEADLTNTDLRKVNLSGADLKLADLTGANLKRADLTGADLEGADLSNAEYNRNNLTDATRVESATGVESTTQTTQRRTPHPVVTAIVGAITAYGTSIVETKRQGVELAQKWRYILIYVGLVCFVSGIILLFLQSYIDLGGTVLFDISMIIAIVGALIAGVGAGSRLSDDPDKKPLKEQTESDEFPEGDTSEKNYDPDKKLPKEQTESDEFPKRHV